MGIIKEMVREVLREELQLIRAELAIVAREEIKPFSCNPFKSNVFQGATNLASKGIGLTFDVLKSTLSSPKELAQNTCVLVVASCMAYKSWSYIKESDIYKTLTVKSILLEVDCSRNKEVISTTSKYGKVMESVKEGSFETKQLTGAYTKYQASLGYSCGDEFRSYGGVVRMTFGENHDYLILSHHALADVVDQTKSLSHPQGYFEVMGKQSRIKFQNYNLIEIVPDIIAVSITPAQAATIGISTAEIGYIPEGFKGVQVAITGIGQMGTIGSLTHDEQFGYSVYAGTTRGGYSGCAYFNGNKMLALHQFGGNANTGPAASYILMKLKGVVQIAPETTEWLDQMMREGNYVEINSYHYDEGVEIRIKGKYHRVQKDTLTKHFGDGHWEIGGKYRGVKKQAYNDNQYEEEPESKSYEEAVAKSKELSKMLGDFKEMLEEHSKLPESGANFQQDPQGSSKILGAIADVESSVNAQVKTLRSDIKGLVTLSRKSERNPKHTVELSLPQTATYGPITLQKVS